MSRLCETMQNEFKSRLQIVFFFSNFSIDLKDLSNSSSLHSKTKVVIVEEGIASLNETRQINELCLKHGQAIWSESSMVTSNRLKDKIKWETSLKGLLKN